MGKSWDGALPGVVAENFEQEWQGAIARLRQWSRIPLMPLWDVRDVEGEPTAWVEDARQIWMWSRGQKEQRFRLDWVVPEDFHGLPLAGEVLRLKLAWWADWAEVLIDGDRVYEGDLFDRDCRLLLSGSATIGRSFECEIRLKSPGHDDGALQTSHIEVEYPEHACEPGQLADELAVLWHCRQMWGDWEAGEWLGRLRQCLDGEIDARWFDDLDRLRQELLPLGAELKKRRVMLLGNAHIDVAWLWPIAETKDVVRRTFESVLKLQGPFPRMTFNQSTALSYQWIEEEHPELFERVKGAIASGWWDVTGGMWVEPDCNLPSGESLVRQVLYGKGYLKRLCDREIRVAWNPDSFGFCWQLPQILLKSGFEIFITQKLAWNDTNQFPHALFWWQGLDGSRILTHCSNEIGQAVEPEAIAQYSSELADKHGVSEVMWLYGVGDHGGGPTADMLNVARRWARSDLFFAVEPGTTEDYLERLQQSLPALNLPVWDDELYLELHRGTYTTKADRKRQNRQLEVLLGTVERVRAMAAIARGVEYPLEALTTAWQKVLTNQFHDILPGTAIPQVFEDADRADAEARAICEQELAIVLDEGALGHGEISDRFCVWNGLNWERSVLVELPGDESVVAAREVMTGRLLPIQRVEEGLLFLAKLPSVGTAGFELVRDGESPEYSSELVVDRDRLENCVVCVQLDVTTGDILQIVDKRTQRQLLSAPAGLQCFDDRGQYWDAWNIDPDYESKPLHEFELISMEVVEAGPLRGSVRVVRQFRQSTIVQTLRLEANNPQLFIHTQLDWQDTYTLLKAAFPLSFSAPSATYEIPFGAIARSTVRETEIDASKWEVPALRWADMSGDGVGLAVLNDCKYGYDAKPDCLRLTLLKSPTWPHPTSDLGQHEFTYSLLPHAGDWRDTEVVRRGYELNCLPMVLGEGWDTGSLLEIDADNVVLAALKRSEDNCAWIVRLYEAHGKAVEAKA
ncbi:MAG: glycoside hydrolase family 38 C-terminal domain-containing protein, partial [Cyanobacteria bacterium J06642_12]